MTSLRRHRGFVPSPKVTRTAPTGRTVTSTLDSLGRVVKVQVPGIDDVTISYDAGGRGVASVTHNGRTSTISYNASTSGGYGGGLPASITDALGNVTNFGNTGSGTADRYDQAGRPLRYTLPNVSGSARQVILAYDASGNATSLTPPGKTAHSFLFDPIDATSLYTPPVLASELPTSYQYDRDGQLTRMLRPDGTGVTLSYDSGGRMVSVIEPVQAKTYSYSYNPGGHVASVTLSGHYNLNFSYAGALPTEEWWTSAATGGTLGKVGRSFKEGRIRPK